MIKKTKYILVLLILSLSISCMPEPDMEPITQQCHSTISSSLHPSAEVYQSVLDKYTSMGLPGLSVVVRTSDGMLWTGASGYARIEDETPMAICNEIYPASIGKTFSAISVLLLVDDGLVELDAPVSNYLSAVVLEGFEDANIMTVRQLLNHTSGLTNLDWNDKFLSDIFNNPFSIKTEDLLNYERGLKTKRRPGEKFKYSSTGYELLAALVEEVTGDHAAFYTQRIFNPLNLQQTFYKNEPSYPLTDNLVNSYFDRFDNEKIENISKVNNHLTSIFTGSDGLISTPTDLYGFLKAVIEGPFLSDETRAELMNFFPTGKQNFIGYGLGLWQRKTNYGNAIGHDGDAIGAGADMWYFPEHDTYIVLTTNLGTVLTDMKLTRMYEKTFQDEFFKAVLE